MKMLTINSKITKKIENNFRKFKNLKKSCKRNLKEITKGMLLKKTCFLSEIGRVQSKEMNDRKNIERYSNALAKADTETMIKEHLKSKIKWFNEISYRETSFPKSPNLILVDGGEIEKANCPRKFQTEEGQKMQYCCGTANGSNGHKPSWGYKMTNISLHNEHSKRTHILSQHLFSSNAPDYISDWNEQKNKMELINEIIRPTNSIILEDSIGDDEKRINFYMNKMNCHFIVRGQNKRKYDININGDCLRMLFTEIGQNIDYDKENMRTYFDKKVGKKVLSKISYREVKHPELKNNEKELHKLFLVLIQSEAYKEPMALLTDIEPTTTEEAWQIFFWYKRRWEVEKIYRDIKQKFKLESALIRNYNAWKTLVVLTALAWEITNELAIEVKEFLGVFYNIFADWLKKKQQKKVTHLNLLDWIREFLPEDRPFLSQRFYSWKIFLQRFMKDKDQLSLFDNRRKMVNF